MLRTFRSLKITKEKLQIVEDASGFG